MNNKILGAALAVGGVILLVFGFNARDSLGSQIKEAVDGTPTDKSMLFLIGGGIALAIGIGLMLMGRKRVTA